MRAARRLRLAFHGSRITSNARLLAYRELDEAVGLPDLAGDALWVCRRGRDPRDLLAGLLRQSAFGRLFDHEAVNDAGRLAHDPAMRAWSIVAGWLTSEAKLAAVADLASAWIGRVHAHRPQSVALPVMDSNVSKTRGGQQGTAYRGHVR